MLIRTKCTQSGVEGVAKAAINPYRISMLIQYENDPPDRTCILMASGHSIWVDGSLEQTIAMLEEAKHPGDSPDYTTSTADPLPPFSGAASQLEMSEPQHTCLHQMKYDISRHMNVCQKCGFEVSLFSELSK